METYEHKTTDVIRNDVKNEFKAIEARTETWYRHFRDDQQIYDAWINIVNRYINQLSSAEGMYVSKERWWVKDGQARLVKSENIYKSEALKYFKWARESFKLKWHKVVEDHWICWMYVTTSTQNKEQIEEIARTLEVADRLALAKIKEINIKQKQDNAREHSTTVQRWWKPRLTADWKDIQRQKPLFEQSSDWTLTFTDRVNSLNIQQALGNLYGDHKTYKIDYSKCNNQRIKSQIKRLTWWFSWHIQFDTNSGNYVLCDENWKILSNKVFVYDWVTVKETWLIKLQKEIKSEETEFEARAGTPKPILSGSGNEELKIKEGSTAETLNLNSPHEQFINSIKNNRGKIINKYPVTTHEYDEIAKRAVWIYFTETKGGLSPKYTAKAMWHQLATSIPVVSDLYDYVEEEHGKEFSRWLTQIKFDTLFKDESDKEFLKKEFNINNENDLDDPIKCWAATMVWLIKNYKNIILPMKQDPFRTEDAEIINVKWNDGTTDSFAIGKKVPMKIDWEEVYKVRTNEEIESAIKKFCDAHGWEAERKQVVRKWIKNNDAWFDYLYYTRNKPSELTFWTATIEQYAYRRTATTEIATRTTWWDPYDYTAEGSTKKRSGGVR